MMKLILSYQLNTWSQQRVKVHIGRGRELSDYQESGLLMLGIRQTPFYSEVNIKT